jgi:hypothetical protein
MILTPEADWVLDSSLGVSSSYFANSSGVRSSK